MLTLSASRFGLGDCASPQDKGACMRKHFCPLDESAMTRDKGFYLLSITIGRSGPEISAAKGYAPQERFKLLGSALDVLCVNDASTAYTETRQNESDTTGTGY